MTDLTVGTRQRIEAIDRLRGLVMILMAIDHVRDFFSITAFAPEDLTQTDTGYFLTRWITHFCAPIFVFLSGVSAWLHQGNKELSAKELSLFLLTRGLWLILLELTVITFFWQFAYNFMIMQVIWAIGWSMIFLALLVFLPRQVTLLIGLAMVFSHNLFDGLSPASFGSLGWLWNILHVQTFFNTTPMGFGLFVGYPLIPWVGVAAVGYGLGSVFDQPETERNRSLLILGATTVGVFLLLRGFNLYGESGVAPADAIWTDHGRGVWFAVMSFVNTTKYPPSLLFLCMTIGPALLLMPMFERMSGPVGRFITVFGRVPFLFYILHLPLINLAATFYNKAIYDQWRINFFNPASWPESYEPSLLRLYVVWALVIFVLYWPCKAFMNYRKTHKQWWLSYL